MAFRWLTPAACDPLQVVARRCIKKMPASFLRTVEDSGPRDSSRSDSAQAGLSTAILPVCWQSDPMWQHIARSRELRLVSELLPPPAC